jgi:hypothetical protein
LAESWEGTSWSIRTTPNPAGAAISNLLNVSCFSAVACTAVGYYNISTGVTVTLAESWDGRAWSLETTPEPAGASYSELGAVSCASASACTAVGYYFDTSGTDVTLAEGWNGSGWSVESTPNPAGASDSTLVGVSCTSATACTAVGSYNDRAGTLLPLAERWDGTTWSMETVPSPAGARASRLFGVSCTSPSACTSVGTVTTSAGLGAALAEAWNGKSWGVQATPNPAGANGTMLSAVSCTAEGTCAAVGSYQDGGFGGVTLAEAWNGKSWSVQATPVPAGANDATLSGVGCSSTNMCTAVGYYLTGAGLPVSFAEGWDGSRWSLQSTPLPAGAILTVLNGVSCTPTNCTAVGYAQGRAGIQETLALNALITPEGFWLATANGTVFGAGTALTLPGTPVPSSDPVVGIAATADGKGFWLVTANGSVFASGDARSHGTRPGLRVHVSDIVAIAPTGDGGGYWLMGRDGGEFAFGDARYHGSLPGIGVHVNDIAGMVATSDGGGYWIVGSDGGVFAFGNARFVGSLPGLHVRVNDIVAMIASPTREGYLLVGADGGAFVFGAGVQYFGSLPGEHIRVSDIVGLALTQDASGYWFAGANAAVYPFGDAQDLAVASSITHDLPVVAIAAA